jgi:hypothetical protein
MTAPRHVPFFILCGNWEEYSTDTGFLKVWVIPETNEVFTKYEPYLQRMDFYKQKRFICEITGHSGLNFFEALSSEVCNKGSWLGGCRVPEC